MGQETEPWALKVILGTDSFIENWECVEKQTLNLSLPGFFQSPKQSFASAQTMVLRGSNNCHTIDGSRITSWRVDLASPQPEPKDLLLWSSARQCSLSLESHSRFIHGDVNWKGIKTHILLTTGALSASLPGSPATTALVRVRHLALRIALQRNRVTAGLGAEGGFNQTPAGFPRNLFIFYSSNLESIKSISSLASCDLNGLWCLLYKPERRWASPCYLASSAEK